MSTLKVDFAAALKSSIPAIIVFILADAVVEQVFYLTMGISFIRSFEQITQRALGLKFHVI